MAKDKDNDNDNDRIFDVTKPGGSSPSSTSKPVIVGHRNMVEDPMLNAGANKTLEGVSENEDTKTETESKENVGPHQAKPVMPLSPHDNDDKVAEPETVKAVESKPTDETPPTPEAVPKTEAASEKPEGANDSLPEAEDSKPVDKTEKISEEEQAKQEAIQQLIASKQYVVHVGEAHHRKLSRTNVIIIAVVGLILVAFTAYLLK